MRQITWSTPPHAVLIGCLTLLLALGPLTIDLYLPALPSMQHDLGASEATIQLTVTGATIGFGLGQLFVGPLSDSIGRRIPLLFAALVHVAASIGVGLSSDVFVTGCLRFVQGVGCTAASVVAVAIVRDVYRGRQFVRANADLGAVAGLTPIVATLAGSALLLLVDWRWISVIVAGYGLLTAVIVAALIPETLEKDRRHPIGWRSLAARYRLLIRDRRYVAATLVSMMGWSVLFANLSASPFLLQRTFGLRVGGYGLVFAALTVLTLITSQITSRVLIPKWGPTRIIPVFALVGLVASSLVIVGAELWPGALAGLLGPLPVLLMASTGASTCAGIVGISGHRGQAGTAASLAGSLNFLTAGVVTAIIGLLGTSSALGLGVVGLCAVGIAGLAGMVLRRQGDPAELLSGSIPLP